MGTLHQAWPGHGPGHRRQEGAVLGHGPFCPAQPPPRGHPWRSRRTGPVPGPGAPPMSPPTGMPTAPPPSPGSRHRPAGSGRTVPSRPAPSRPGLPVPLLPCCAEPRGSLRDGGQGWAATSAPLRPRGGSRSEKVHARGVKQTGACFWEVRREAPGCRCHPARPGPGQTGPLCVRPFGAARPAAASPRRTPPAPAAARSRAFKTTTNPLFCGPGKVQQGCLIIPAAIKTQHKTTRTHRGAHADATPGPCAEGAAPGAALTAAMCTVPTPSP